MFFIYLILVMSTIAAYLSFRLIFRLNIRFIYKLLLTVLIFIIVNKMSLMHYVAGSIMMNGLQNSVIILTAWLHISVVLSALVLLIFDLFSIVFRKSRMQIFTPSSRALTVFSFGLVLALWGVFTALRAPSVHEIELKINNLPPELVGFKLAHLADIHLGPLYGADWAKTVVERTNAANPDIVLIVGDTIDGTPQELKELTAPLADLQAPYGKYMALGNHEYYWGAYRWIDEFKSLGFKVLHNSHETVEIKGLNLAIGGLADFVTERDARYRGNFEAPNVEKTFAGAPKDFRIVLDHQPGKALRNAPHANLQLSGHTHGGLLLPLQKIVAEFNGGFVSGLYNLDTMDLFVSNGVGLWAGFPVRLFVPSQILILKLAPLS